MPGTLITGGTGYIGSNLINYIQDHEPNGYQPITVIDRTIKKNNLKNTQDLNFIEFDLQKNLEQLYKLIKETNLLIHASYLGDNESERRFLQFVLQNNPQLKLVFLSSAAVYGENDSVNLETDNAKPINDYGRAKLASENYIKENFSNYLIFRIANPYGNLPAKGFYRILSSKLKSGERNISLNADYAEQIIRDFIHIDVLSKEIIELSKLSNREIFNISSGEGTSLEEFTYMIAEELNIPKTEIKFIYNGVRSGEIKHSILDNSKLLSNLSKV